MMAYAACTSTSPGPGSGTSISSTVVFSCAANRISYDFTAHLPHCPISSSVGPGMTMQSCRLGAPGRRRLYACFLATQSPVCGTDPFRECPVCLPGSAHRCGQDNTTASRRIYIRCKNTARGSLKCDLGP